MLQLLPGKALGARKLTDCCITAGKFSIVLPLLLMNAARLPTSMPLNCRQLLLRHRHDDHNLLVLLLLL